MVKLQKHKAYTYQANDGEKIDHYKYSINIPESAIAELGWAEGQEINLRIDQHALALKAGKGPKGEAKEK